MNNAFEEVIRMNSALAQAIELRTAGQAEEAKRLLMKLNEQMPDDPAVLYQLAWTCDSLGHEKEAVPYYEAALRLGLPGEDEIGALLGLGSTYRTLARYEHSAELFEQAIARYPDRREFRVFYAMTLYNLGRHAEAMRHLLAELAETSDDAGIRSYGRAILFYSDKLDQTWE